MTSQDIDNLDQILFNCIESVGVREEGTVMDLDTLIIDRPKAVAALLKWRDKAVVAKEKQAQYLLDALIRAAKFMHDNNLLPPDTTTVTGIQSYFLNEARFKETKQREAA